MWGCRDSSSGWKDSLELRTLLGRLESEYAKVSVLSRWNKGFSTLQLFHFYHLKSCQSSWRLPHVLRKPHIPLFLLKLKWKIPSFQKIWNFVYDISRFTELTAVLYIFFEIFSTILWVPLHSRLRIISDKLFWASGELRFLSYSINFLHFYSPSKVKKKLYDSYMKGLVD